MFYAQFVLSKKGPLARIWLAAHWDKKLTKAHVFETNIEGSVEAIIQPKVKLALRTSGHLLLGVVRIYSRKAKYLLADCNEAFVKIKMAFRPGVVDLPEESREAAAAAITLPETFPDFETTMADLNDFDTAQFSVNQSRPEEITIREDFGSIQLVNDYGFANKGDMGFGVGDNLLGDVNMEDNLFVKPADPVLDPKPAEGDKTTTMDIDLPRDDAFGAALDDCGQTLQDLTALDNLGAGLFDEQPTTMNGQTSELQPPVLEKEAVPQNETAPVANATHLQEQTTLIPNEAEAFALEPIDVTSMGMEKRAKRKRKLVIDEQKGIPSETMKNQLANTQEIIGTLDLAPPSKKLMLWKETGGVEKLFALPGRAIATKKIMNTYSCNFITRAFADRELDQMEDFGATRDDDTESNVTSIDAPRDVEKARDRDGSVMGDAFEDPPSIINESSRRISNRPNMMSNRDPSLDSTLLPPRDPSMGDISGQLAPVRRPSDDYDDDNDFVGGFDESSLSPPPAPVMHDIPEVNEDLQALPEDDAQLEPGETEEEYEERRWKGRTQQMMHVVSRAIKAQGQVSFSSMTARNTRKQVASKFYTLLVLKKLQAIEVAQPYSFGDITITQGPQLLIS